MRVTDRQNPSLWWRLSWQLSVVITTVVTTAIIGICFWATTVMSPNIAREETIADAVAGAVERDPQGKLKLRDMSELEAIKARNARLWYVASTTDGDSVSYGTVPPVYAGITDLVHLFQDADLRGAAVTTEIASIENVETSVGEVRILFGGFDDKGWPVLALLIKSYPIYIPMIALALPMIFLTVPRIVRRALSGVKEVAQKASEIEPRRPHARLPTGGIPKEVVPLVIAFNGALERLDNEFRKRRRFLIDAAHELRTPIAIMQTRIDGMPEEAGRKRLLDDVARLANMAEQLLEFERNDQTTEDHESVDLVDIARTVVADLAPLAIAAGYEISFHSNAEKLERQGNPSALFRAIGNLIRNAIDHGGNAGKIRVSAMSPGRISVSDDGPGIPAEHQASVFEPFYRATPKSSGAGLGLSLVKQIVTGHRGQITIASTPNGTEVVMDL